MGKIIDYRCKPTKDSVERLKQLTREKYMAFAVLSINFAYNKSLYLSDKIEEMGLMKQNVKRTFNAYEKLCRDRLASLKRQYKTKASWYCVQDYMRIYNECVEGDMEKLVKACRYYLKRKHKQNSELYGEVGAVGILWCIVEKNVMGLVKCVSDRTHYNLLNDEEFRYMDITPIYNQYRIFESVISNGCNDVDLGKSAAVIRIVSSMAEHMYDADMVKKGLDRAIELNRDNL